MAFIYSHCLAKPLDTQIVEILGRNRLISELSRAGFEVAVPLRDRGVDLIAYIDRGSCVDEFRACPIQMKACSERAFSVDTKYASFPNLVIAHVWNVDAEGDQVTYALTYQEAAAIADELRWTKTHSWSAGLYVTTKPSIALCRKLEPFRMNPHRWREKLLGIVEGHA